MFTPSHTCRLMDPESRARCRACIVYARERADLDARIERERDGRPFVVRFRNAIRSGPSEVRYAADVDEARLLARDVRPWNNTAVTIVEHATGAEVPTRGDRCICCPCVRRADEPRFPVTPHPEHYATACAIHPERGATSGALAGVAPYRIEVPA